MTVVVISAVSLAASLGISGLLILGHRLCMIASRSRYKFLIIPAAVPFILMNLLLGIYFRGMAMDVHSGGTGAQAAASVYIWAIPACVAFISIGWLLFLILKALKGEKGRYG